MKRAPEAEPLPGSQREAGGWVGAQTGLRSRITAGLILVLPIRMAGISKRLGWTP